MSLGKKPLELYVHIPFCVKKCSYCDFLSFPSGRKEQEAYMAALFAEIERRGKDFGDYRVTSVFIGGGTPSVLPGEWIRELTERLRENFCLPKRGETEEISDGNWPAAYEVEFTIEVNPGTVDAGKLRTYFDAGINRLSIGLQSASDRELQLLGRIHNWEQFLETYGLAREAGFHNINVDLMSALPGQSLDSYRETLEKVLALNPPPEHISAYSLIIEEGTPFAEMAENGLLELPEEDCERQMYQDTQRILRRFGYHRYEISNYAKDGYQCRHNCGYWQRADYLGLGLGAASLVGNCRFRNTEDFGEYLEYPATSQKDVTCLTTEEQMEETMFLGLRLTKGVDGGEFQRIFGESLEEVYGDVIEKNVGDGLLEYKEGHRIALTSRGLDLSNYVMAQFLL